ncbi:MAG: LysM peptidoglycan-binding domain-containing protein, partial [Solirubrobacterales bacterium]|nr:LysM peptidoglycan-binding domain-containing protein [Solirubrobacterales bacterium]
MTFAAAASMAVPATASAFFVHVIAPGETLYSIAAADGLSLDQLAAANGLSPTTQLVAGQTIQIPPQQSSSSPSAISTVSS